MTMSSDQFAEAVRERADVGDRQLLIKTRDFMGNYDQAVIQFYNVPPSVADIARGGGGATAANNRLLLFVDGFGKEQGTPATGKVKMTVCAAELLHDNDMKRPRGRTTTPEKMVDYVAGILSRAAKLEPKLPRGRAANPKEDLEKGLILEEGEVFVKVGSHREYHKVPNVLGYSPRTYYNLWKKDRAATYRFVITEDEFRQLKDRGVKVTRSRLKTPNKWAMTHRATPSWSSNPQVSVRESDLVKALKF